MESKSFPNVCLRSSTETIGPLPMELKRLYADKLRRISETASPPCPHALVADWNVPPERSTDNHIHVDAPRLAAYSGIHITHPLKARLRDPCYRS